MPQLEEPGEPHLFGARLKRYRKRLDLTQAELAEQVGCAISTIQAIEQDLRRPSKQLAQLLAQRLGFSKEEAQLFVQVARRGGLEFPSFEATTPSRLALPTPLTSMVDRSIEANQIRQLMFGDDVRLVTLTGAPGVGKTRLSIQAGEMVQELFSDGVLFIPLATVSDQSHFLPTLASALGIPEAGSGLLAERLKNVLRGRRALLILDNFEQLLAAGPLLTDLLVNCPLVKALVTSRVRLDVYGEFEYAVRPFELPPFDARLSPGELMQYDAVRLFVLRVRAFQHEFVINDENAAAMTEIVRRLDGLPLAIELAAARLRDFTLSQLANHLAQPGMRLPVLSGGARDLPARQQTLMDAIAWSYNLLDKPARHIFRQLAVFNGGCTWEAALAVCEGATNVLIRLLIDHNLLQEIRDERSVPRLLMLETLREYAQQRLVECGMAPAVNQLHLEYYLQLAQEAEPHFRCSDDRIILRRMDCEIDNLRQALEWGLDQAPEQALRLAGLLWLFWFKLGNWTEGRAWVEAALNSFPGAPDFMRLPALTAAASFSFFQGDLDRAEETSQECLALSIRSGDQQRRFLSLHHLASILDARGDPAAAVQLMDQALQIARQLKDSWLISMGLTDLGNYFLSLFRLEQAKECFIESLDYAQQEGDHWESLYGWVNLARVAYLQGDLERAAELGQVVLVKASDYGDRQVIAGAMGQMGLIAFRRGDHTAAEAHLVQAIELTRDLGQIQELPRVLVELAECLLESDPRRAARLASAATTIRLEQSTVSPVDDIQAASKLEKGLRDRLGEMDFLAAWTEGQHMTVEQIIEVASR